MIRYGLNNVDDLKGCWLSIGNFDGVHLGHRRMLTTLVAHAHRQQRPATVMTFDPPPVALLAPDKLPPRLSTVERKAELMKRLGITALLVYPTDKALLQLSARNFFEQIILDRFNACGIVEGPNFFFGHKRSGNIDTLREYCARHQRGLEIVEPIEFGGELVSSTRIRGLILAGRFNEAVELLGHPYEIQGVVKAGAQRGRTLGFPTANLEQIHNLIPGEAVYAGRVTIGEHHFAAAVNIGPNPTFNEFQHKVEVHVLDFAGDLYDQRLSVELIREIRKVESFSDSESLTNQLNRDLAQCRAAFTSLHDEEHA